AYAGGCPARLALVDTSAPPKASHSAATTGWALMRTARLRWLPVTQGGAWGVAGIAQVFGPGQLAITSVMRPAGSRARSSHGRTASSPAATTIRPLSTGRCLI